MPTTKRCGKCGKVKPLSQFYRRSRGSPDGHWKYCKACEKIRVNQYRYGDCKICGDRVYLRNGYEICPSCRREPRKMNKVPYINRIDCDSCKFYKTCKIRVFQTDQEHWDWMPPCFVTSEFHAAYLQEYGAMA